jgi:hypothetical protein
VHIIEHRRTFYSPHRVAFILAACVAVSAVFISRGYAGLIITPTFDSSITSDPNAAAIEGVIDSAIAVYERDFSDSIDVTIDYKEMTSGLGHSSWYYYTISYQTYINHLRNDATTANDAIALANLPSQAANPVTGSDSIRVKTANLRAIGITGDGSGLAGGYDGVVSLNTHITDVGSPGTSGEYSLISTVEHETDEVLGLGSSLPSTSANPLPEDLFRYTKGPNGTRTYTTSGDNAYFSIDGGVTDLARFNQDSSGDYGDWWSNNGGGNPGPNPPTEVQDAFLYGHRTPTLGVELTALDVIGYNLVPEPGSLTLLALGIAAIGCWKTKRMLASKTSAAASG